MQKWYQSKKFWALVLGVGSAAGSVLTGEATVAQGLGSIVTLVGIYLGAQGVVDLASVLKGKNQQGGKS